MDGASSFGCHYDDAEEMKRKNNSKNTKTTYIKGWWNKMNMKRKIDLFILIV